MRFIASWVFAVFGLLALFDDKYSLVGIGSILFGIFLMVQQLLSQMEDFNEARFGSLEKHLSAMQELLKALKAT